GLALPGELRFQNRPFSRREALDVEPGRELVQGDQRGLVALPIAPEFWPREDLAISPFFVVQFPGYDFGIGGVLIRKRNAGEQIPKGEETTVGADPFVRRPGGDRLARQFLSRPCVPHRCPLVVGTGDDPGAVPAERRAHSSAGVPL